MSLLREIQNDVASSEADVTAVLRKCKILAARLDNAEFSQWVDQELNGYPEEPPIPEYRRLPVIYCASFLNVGWRVERAVVPLQIVPEEFRDSFKFIEFREGIAKAVSLARPKSETQITIPRPELTFVLQGKLYPEMYCHGVWGELQRVDFEQLLSAVSSRILDFSLKLEAENPAAGEASPKTEPVPREKVTSLVQNVIYGNVGAIAQASAGFTQSVSVGVVGSGNSEPLFPEILSRSDFAGKASSKFR